jgi:excinuclease UvrABC ATPase subunit
MRKNTPRDRCIHLLGARQNNLKNIDVDIPSNRGDGGQRIGQIFSGL